MYLVFSELNKVFFFWNLFIYVMNMLNKNQNFHYLELIRHVRLNSSNVMTISVFLINNFVIILQNLLFFMKTIDSQSIMNVWVVSSSLSDVKE